jgi:PIN domain nuclease of toxin-antitoxin system
MPDVVTDTHALIWYLEDSPRLGSAARSAFEACDRGECVVYVPTICLVEIIYLQEKGRIPTDLKSALDAALQAGNTGLVPSSLTRDIVDALVQVPRTEVPDMPGRIIAATAVHLGVPLISRDRKLQLSNVPTIWE